MRYLVRLLLLIFYCHGYAQKPSLDQAAYKSWPSLNFKSISNDGEYVSYEIKEGNDNKKSVSINSTTNDWAIKIYTNADAGEPIFTNDSRFFILRVSSDSLCVLNTRNKSIQYIRGIKDVKVSSSTSVIGYTEREHTTLTLLNLKSNSKVRMHSVLDYQFCDNGNMVLIKIKDEEGSNKTSLMLLSLTTGKSQRVWTGDEILTMTWSGDQKRIAIQAKNKQDEFHSFWLFTLGDTAARCITSSAVILRDFQDMEIERIEGLNNEGRFLFLLMRERTVEITKQPSDVSLNVWSYSDEKLQSQQLTEPEIRSYRFVFDIKDRKMLRLEGRNDFIQDFNMNQQAFLITHYNGNVGSGEADWNIAGKKDYYILNLPEGSRRLIKRNTDFKYRISPGGHFAIYYDPDESSYFSYEFENQRLTNITKGLNTKWYSSDKPGKPFGLYNLAGWYSDDKALLIYDEFDIWQLDPSGIRPPRNLTNGYGQKTKTVLRFASESEGQIDTIKPSLLAAFNQNNKHNGFYSMVLNSDRDPERLVMGPFIFDIKSNPYIPDGVNFSVRKSLNNDAFVVRRMSASEFPNLFFTRDFKNFRQLTFLCPQKQYNWYRTELHTFGLEDSIMSKGVLYKPENFDPKKRYPVILTYYERKSDGLNAYLTPEDLSNGCSINIPTYVSSEYLVFVPDIYFQVGEPGESTRKYVVSAAKYLAKLPYVDSARLGIQGCSFGGFETNYLVTHTNLFSAACSASGISNFISGYGSLAGDGSVLQNMYESTFWRMGFTPWEKPEWYINNSPIFKVNQVSTPLLMFHTSVDGVCPFTQAIELFTALRRLGKKAWLLEYNDGNHGVEGNSAKDFAIRMHQFFDHYLKGKPCPRWMLQGIPANLKRIDLGLELDSSGKTPGLGLTRSEY
ncbi:alpha/beta hydrolase family protein [Pedobacter faecalis]|uniref:alpha/beta hydrolase family protein n=1 Tax=Pedobacter faecalis TaxID=3041495 RepID=UPI00254B4BD8|nr:prolyl oligopeptidase family serine peptidase [Pedobacter sp. ELA7]